MTLALNTTQKNLQKSNSFEVMKNRQGNKILATTKYLR